MTKALVQFRVEENTKSQATKICDMLGIDLPTYYRMCTSRLIQEGGIPFGLKIREYGFDRRRKSHEGTSGRGKKEWDVEYDFR